MGQNFARNWLVPLSVLFSRQNELLPDNFSENLTILEIFVIGPHALPQCTVIQFDLLLPTPLPPKTSPPSARVAAMSDMQQKTSKTEQPHKSFKLLLNNLPLSWNFLETSMEDLKNFYERSLKLLWMILETSMKDPWNPLRTPLETPLELALKAWITWNTLETPLKSPSEILWNTFKFP